MIRNWLKELFIEALEEKINLFKASRHSVIMHFEGEDDPVHPEDFFTDSTYINTTTGGKFILQTKWTPKPQKPATKKKASKNT